MGSGINGNPLPKYGFIPFFMTASLMGSGINGNLNNKTPRYRGVNRFPYGKWN